jgi:hypothetical protein
VEFVVNLDGKNFKKILSLSSVGERKEEATRRSQKFGTNFGTNVSFVRVVMCQCHTAQRGIP